MNNEIAVQVNGLTKLFKLRKPNLKTIRTSSTDNKFAAIANVTFSVSKGEVLGIIGLNGSGKTTLLRTISGIYQPDSGTVNVSGKLAPLLQIGSGFQPDLDVIDNIVICGLLTGLDRNKIKQNISKIIDYAGINQFSHMKLKHLSSGMKARLAFAICMQMKPDIVLVDEILAVGDRIFKEKSYKEFLSLKKEGKTIIHTTHNLQKASQFSDRILLIDKGKIIIDGKPDEVVKHYEDLVNSNK